MPTTIATYTNDKVPKEYPLRKLVSGIMNHKSSQASSDKSVNLDVPTYSFEGKNNASQIRK